MIEQNVRRILSQLSVGVKLVAAAKTRTTEETLEAIAAGVEIIGHNYIQEAERAHQIIGGRARWHFIGHLQKNKVKKAAVLFDMIETVDSLEMAREIDTRCARIGKVMPVLIEVNSGRETRKNGVLPDEVEGLVRQVSALNHIKVEGLMTMGSLVPHPEDSRPYFSATHRLFEEIKGLNLPNVDMRYLSMGMSDSYKIALEEGANIVRLGSLIFGPRA
ncbi:MAG: YggS family pyridoxal phosphate-dependent enzyme [Dehalococcoidales bacterium]